MIVGGGTAGWLSAAYLNRALGSSVRITVVESASVSRVGVGEATVPTMVSTLAFLGIDERVFMRRCNATFKAAIKYVNWAHGGRGDRADEFYHPFYDRPELLARPFGDMHFPFVGEGFSSADVWAAQGSDRDPRFDRVSSAIPAVSDALAFSPERLPGSQTLQYAYHMDAMLFADMLAEVAQQRGVERRVDHVRGVELDERGFVRSLATESGAALTADLFIDCSGFRGLLINGALQEPFSSDAKYLACDAAVALPAASVPARDGILPYTTATALSAGWSWRVPLFQRFGCGYVYSSDHASPSEAEQELRDLLGPAAGQDAAHLRMRVGRCRRSWVNNCVAIGLSSCFLEPLESTAIFMVEYQLAQLVNLFPSRRFAPARIHRYNETLNDMYDHLRDFIVMHYCTTSRGDTAFWRRIRDDMPIPDSLATILDEYRVGVLPQDRLRFRLFRSRSYTAILSGMGVYPDYGPPILGHAPPAAGDALLADIAKRTAALLASLPAHYDYVRGLHE
ncbi:putative tryptophan halogenase [Enhygromyxa salina]|uniref:Putative tryptophan halogenase n=1 Tax=Enhygromyxa salina TaxID=215803 RepID=A0A0C1Z5J5_9BACT|nr:putative tryptophan halogenase [Enhygromyxa salina]